MAEAQIAWPHRWWRASWIAKVQAPANDGIDTLAIQDGLGHVSITHTTCCTTLSQTRFKDFWRD